MTTFLLIRHGETNAGAEISGRLPHVHLSENGKREVSCLSEKLALLEVDLIAASPLDRTRETAELISARIKSPVEYYDALLEIDFGEWTGRSFDELEQIELWHLWQQFRSGTRIPGGELIVEVQTRAVLQLERLHQQLPNGVVAVVSHGDPIKAMIAYYIGLSLENMRRLRIQTASLTTLIVTRWGAELVGLNRTC
jgi:broad specificity phosphatase PhoE